MKKVCALILAVLVIVLAGCYDSTPYDGADIEIEREKAYRDGYDDGYAEGFEAGQLSIIEAEEPALPAPTVDIFAPSRTVSESEGQYYVTRTGECFHKKNGCQYEPYIWYATREEAIADGYSPCSRCNP